MGAVEVFRYGARRVGGTGAAPLETRMLKSVLAPIHPDGWRFIAAAVVVAVIVFWLGWTPVGWLALVVAAWIAYFFRDPWRVTPARPGLVVAPADGVVVAADRASPPKELQMGEAP